MAFWNWKNADKKLSEAMVKFATARGAVYTKYPRLYDAMDLCHVSIADWCPTLAVAPRRNGEYDFFWSPDFINTLSPRQLEGVVKHELLHIVFEHTTTRLPHYDFDIFDPEANRKIKADDAVKAKIWNLATDCAINQFIRDDLKDPSGKQMDCVFPETFGLPEWLNAEAYYRLMADQFKDAMDKLNKLQEQLLDQHQQWEQEGQEGQSQPNSGQKQNGKGKGKGEGEGEGEASGEGQNEQDGSTQKSSATAGHGGASEKDPSGGKTKEHKASDLLKKQKEADEKEANDQKVADIAKDLGVDKFNEQADRVMAARQQGGKGAGKFGGVGSNVVKMDVGAGEKSTPGWMRKTKHESVHGFDILIEQSRKRPNRRYGNVFPGKKRQDVGNKLLIAVDISGSISMELFAKFTQHVNKFTRFSEFDIVFFNDYLVDEDGKVLFSAYEQNTDPRRAIRKFKLNQNQRMGGGTNFETIMLLWNRVCNTYDGLFIFTDGEASYSTPPRQQRSINWIVYPHENAYDKNANKLPHLKHGNVYNMNNEKFSREMPKVK